MSKEFLLEIGCEEIPAWMIPGALEFLGTRLQETLAANHLPFDRMRHLATPRRLTIQVFNLPERQPDRDEIVTGPPVAIGLDAEGKPSRAAEGFARKQGVAPEDLTVITTEKGDYVGFHRQVTGQPAEQVLTDILPGLIGAIPFPKNMYWRPDKFRFVRPIRSLLALLDGEVVPFEVAGIRSADWTFGHRFLGEARIPVTGCDDYIRRLRDNRVLVDPDERRTRIEAEIARHEQESGLQIQPDPALLDEVVYLNEFPSVIMGEFDPRFLDIPREVLVTVMRKHQKYFSMNDARGELAPRFLAVINMENDAQGLIREGHQRVLKARLVDAEFFWTVDRKIPLGERVASLGEVLFQETLGSYLEKAGRLQALVAFLGGEAGLSTEHRSRLEAAARLCKADLVTEMVKEFTELQGIMGGLYARTEGQPEGVWKAIYEHYRPEGTDDAVPESPEGALLSIADKTDTIVGLLGLGLIPTGSRDPFGLRRQAAGIYRILLERELDLSLDRIIGASRDLLRDVITESPDTLDGSLRELLAGRVRFLFQGAGFRYDEINAVLDHAIFRPVDARRRLDALVDIRQVQAFQSIFTARKRIQNILVKQDSRPDNPVRSELLQETEEKNLHQLMAEIDTPLRQSVEDRRYPETLRLIERFAGPVDAFFDRVLVMHEDPAIRRNRLALLARVGELFDDFCDFTSFVIE